MYVFIVNPYAGFGRGNRAFNKIRKSRLFNEIKCEYFFTESPGHGEYIAGMIAKRTILPKTIIVVGGDGTLHEVANGIGDCKLPIAFIPGGSGNDFGRGLSIKGSPVQLFKRIIRNTETIPYWCGTYTINGSGQRQFVNSMGFGFDAEIAHDANTSKNKKWLSFLRLSSLSYVFALLHMLFYFKPVDLTLTMDGKTRQILSCWMVTISNHPYYGGGMKIIPHARIEPNVFPVLVIHGISKWKVLALFMTVYTGKHLSFKEIDCYMASKIEVHSETPVRYQVDGQTGMCTNGVILKNSEPIEVVRAKKEH